MLQKTIDPSEFIYINNMWEHDWIPFDSLFQYDFFSRPFFIHYDLNCLILYTPCCLKNRVVSNMKPLKKCLINQK